jgi:diketogulonate reductase-like aldo/keto reductase
MTPYLEGVSIPQLGLGTWKDAAQVALRWEVQRGHVVIPRSSRESHIRSNAALFDFELGPEEMRRIGGRPRGDRIVDVPWSEFDR